MPRGVRLSIDERRTRMEAKWQADAAKREERAAKRQAQDAKYIAKLRARTRAASHRLAPGESVTGNYGAALHVFFTFDDMAAVSATARRFGDLKPAEFVRAAVFALLADVRDDVDVSQWLAKGRRK